MPRPDRTAAEFLHYHAPDLARGAALLAIAGGVGLWAALLLAPQPNPAPPLLAMEPAATRSLDPLVAWFGSGKGNLQVRITGLIAAGPQGIALLSVDGAPARAYRVGDTLAPGITLDAVRALDITVSQDGLTEIVAAPASLAPARGFEPVDPKTPSR